MNKDNTINPNSNGSSKIKIYFDESGNNGNVMPNKKGNLYSGPQAQFVLGGVIIKDDSQCEILKGKYSDFIEKWQIEGELKSTDLLKEGNRDKLDYFIDHVLDDKHFHVCCYDKKFFIASAISLYLLGSDAQKNDPLYYKYTSALAREDTQFFTEYCKIVEASTNDNIEKFLKYIMNFSFKKITGNCNPYYLSAKKMLDNKSKNPNFPTPYLSKGDYVKSNNANVINLTAIGESLLSICENEKTPLSNFLVYHDKIDQYEDDFVKSLDGIGIQICFLDSKQNEFIQLADCLSGIFRRAFSITVERCMDNKLWEDDYYPKILSKLINRLDPKSFKIVATLADIALFSTIHEMFSDSTPEQDRNQQNFERIFMEKGYL